MLLSTRTDVLKTYSSVNGLSQQCPKEPKSNLKPKITQILTLSIANLHFSFWLRCIICNKVEREREREREREADVYERTRLEIEHHRGRR